jgi:hypothetical protein
VNINAIILMLFKHSEQIARKLNKGNEIMNQKQKLHQRNFGLPGCKRTQLVLEFLGRRTIIFLLNLAVIMIHLPEKMAKEVQTLLMVATPCKRGILEITSTRLRPKKSSRNMKTRCREELKIPCIKNN